MSERIAAIHQPNYLPWIGYFHKIYRSDVFVFLDDVEYTSGSWINRNKIKTPDGWSWLTVPVRETSVPISEVRLVREDEWETEHWKTLTHNYGGADHFEEWEQFFRSTYDGSWERLYPLNRHLIEGICDRLGIECEFVEASAYDIELQAPERLAALCESVDADTYLCGMGADEYMEREAFEQRDVSVKYQDFDYPTYQQRFGDFVPSLSLVDLLLNVGSGEARRILSDL